MPPLIYAARVSGHTIKLEQLGVWTEQRFNRLQKRGHRSNLQKDNISIEQIMIFIELIKRTADVL